VFSTNTTAANAQTKIGVLFAVHGGQDKAQAMSMWNAGMQQMTYDPNHIVYKWFIWNSDNWSAIIQGEMPLKFVRKFDFEYPRIGGTDPYRAITEQQLADLET